MAIWDRFPDVSSVRGSMAGGGPPSPGGAPGGAASASSERPSRDQRTVPPRAGGSAPSTSRTRRPGIRTGSPPATLAVHTPIPSSSSTVNANRSPSGAQTGALTCAPSGSASGRSVPSATRSTDSPWNRLVR